MNDIVAEPRNNRIGTPSSQLGASGILGSVRGMETGHDLVAKDDPNLSSHYYRFKRHSLGYQSQGPATKGSLISMDALNNINGGREQSQTVSGAGAFGGNSRLLKGN